MDARQGFQLFGQERNKSRHACRFLAACCGVTLAKKEKATARNIKSVA
jgi:hypothetical protein